MRGVLNIRFLIPIIAVVLVFGATWIEYALISSRISAKNYESIQQSLRIIAVQTQGHIDRALRRGDLVTVKQSLMDLNYLSLISEAYLLDDELVIQQSTSLGDAQLSILERIPLSRVNYERIYATGIGEVIQDKESQRTTALYPIHKPQQRGDLRPRVWLLIIVFDYEEELEGINAEIRKSSSQSGLIILGAIVVLSLILHLVITRRVFKIVEATNRYLAGETTARARVVGNDELGLIGSAFDRVADAVEQSKAELEGLNHELEKNLYELELRQLALDEHAIVSIANAEGLMTYANQKFCEISGYGQSELINKPHRMLKSEEHEAELLEDLWDTITAGKVWHREMKNRAKDGRDYWVESSIVPLRDPDTKVYQYIVIQTDISHQKELNNKLQATQVKNKRLYGIIAHELRTPLSAIEMMTHHDQAQWIKDQSIISDAAHDLLHRIDDMKMLVNPELKRKMHLEPTTVSDINTSINTMVASAVARTRMNYKLNQILPDVMKNQSFTTDVYRVKAAVTNLVRNACLHSEGSEVSCITSHRFDEQGKAFICWSVSDNGKGVPEDILPNLFKPFERGDSRAEGTGLGLYIAKEWIEELGGELIYRGLEVGSEFVVSIPFNTTKKSELTTSGSAADDSMKHIKKLASELRVLLVEDDALIQKFTKLMLKPLFAVITIASDGEQGMKLATEDYDLILTDYFMPKLTGVEMTERLRRQGYKGPIIGVTAATIGKERQELLSAGADIVLPKPLNANVVLQSLIQLFEAERFPRIK
jgi:PAS domain S-box-containing protein